MYEQWWRGNVRLMYGCIEQMNIVILCGRLEQMNIVISCGRLKQMNIVISYGRLVQMNIGKKDGWFDWIWIRICECLCDAYVMPIWMPICLYGLKRIYGNGWGRKWRNLMFCLLLQCYSVDRVVQWSGKALRLMGSVFGDYRSMCPCVPRLFASGCTAWAPADLVQEIRYNDPHLERQWQGGWTGRGLKNCFES